MSWKPFTKDIQERGHMLFLDKRKCWFEGNLIDDSEYGLLISLFETDTDLEGITHYLIVQLP